MAKEKAEKSYKVARSVAEDEFERWATGMGLEHKFDADFIDPATLRMLSTHRNVIVRAIMLGHCVVNDKSELEFTPQHSPNKETLVFRRPKGAHYKEMDKQSGMTNRTMAFLSGITEKNDNVFDQIDMVYDGDCCSSVAALFLA